MNDEVWLKLAKRVNELLASKEVDGSRSRTNGYAGGDLVLSPSGRGERQTGRDDGLDAAIHGDER